MDLKRANIRTLRAALDSREISAVQLCEEYIRRIENDRHNAFITVCAEQALSSAQQAQNLIDSGKSTALTGIPTAVKDNICTVGIKTTCASRMLADYIPPYDATVIERLKTHGAVILGKTNMDEFAMGGSGKTSYYGVSCNPYDTERVCGGSSSGSAAAVSASLAVCALGSDTGGSVRQPAAFCGVTGMKPTYGRLSRYGLIAYASSLDQIGVICSDAHDCALLLNAVCSHDHRDATCCSEEIPDFAEKIGNSIRGVRIALPREFLSDRTEPCIAKAVSTAADIMKSLGAKIVNCSFPSLKYAVAAYYLIACAEAAANLARFDGIKYGYRDGGSSYAELVRSARTEGFGAEVKRRILLGNYALSSGYYDDYYKKALCQRQRLIEEYKSIFSSADVIMNPTAPLLPEKLSDCPSFSDSYMSDICTVPVNLAGLPAISTTCGYSHEGLPIGVSFTGRWFDEVTIIQCAAAFEHSFSLRIPQEGEVI